MPRTGRPISTPWGQALHDLIVAGPIPYDQLMVEVAAKVPPGRGFRMRERQSELQRNRKRARERTYEDKETRKSVSTGGGARMMASHAISAAKRTGRLVVYEENGVKMAGPGSHPWPE